MERYEKYKDSGVEWIGEIPEGWAVKKVKYLLIPINGIKIGPFGSSLKLSTLSTSGIKIYGQGNIIKDDFSIGTRYLSVEKFEEEFSQYEILDGDVLVTMMGTTGRSTLFKSIYENGILDSHLLRLRFDQKKILSNLFVVVLQESDYVANQIKLHSKGSIMEGLNSSIIKELGVLVPPRSDQTAIANYLDRKTAEIDDLIAQKERLLELYEEEKTAIINQAVTKGIDPDVKLKDSGIEWLGEIPEGWELSKLKYLVPVKDGTHDTPAYISHTDDSFPLITSKDIKSGSINFSDCKHISAEDYENINKRSDVVNGDIIMPMIGTVGGAVIVETKKAFSIKNVALFKTSNSQSVPSYVRYLLDSLFVKEQFVLESRGGVQDFVSLSLLKNIIVFDIQKPEQAAIVHHIETETARINTKIAKTKRIIELQKEYRTALISEVVTGKIRVTQEATS